MKKIKLWLVRFPAAVSALFLGAAVFSQVALAAGGVPTDSTLPNLDVNTKDDLSRIICNFVAYFFWIVLVVSVIMVLFAAFEYVTAADDTEKTTKARMTLTYGAVGIAVALLSTTFPSIVASLFGGATGGGVAPSCVVF